MSSTNASSPVTIDASGPQYMFPLLCVYLLGCMSCLCTMSLPGVRGSQFRCLALAKQWYFLCSTGFPEISQSMPAKWCCLLLLQNSKSQEQ